MKKQTKHTWARWFISFPLLALFSLFVGGIPIASAHSLQPTRPALGAISTNWAGVIISGNVPTSTFTVTQLLAVDADFTVPCINLSASSVGSSLDIWAGVGGTGGSAMRRAGATVRVYQDASGQKQSSYTAWIETPLFSILHPFQIQRVSFPTDCGRTIQVRVTADGYESACDFMTCKTYNFHAAANTSSVEFIVERTSALLPVLSSNPITFTDGHAWWKHDGHWDNRGIGDPGWAKTITHVWKYYFLLGWLPQLYTISPAPDGNKFWVYRLYS